MRLLVAMPVEQSGCSLRDKVVVTAQVLQFDSLRHTNDDNIRLQGGPLIAND